MVTVLVPRGGVWGAAVAAAVVEEGLVPWVLPLVETLPAPSAELTRALGRLREGGYDWLAVSSAAAVPALAEVSVPATTRVAAVGEATASALAEAGFEVALVGDGGAGALLEAWPTRSGSVLVVRSDLARGLLTDGLRERGHEVDSVIAYRTAAAPVSPSEEHALRGGKADVALVTSGSVARRLAELGVPDGTRLVAMGEQTATDTREAGLHPAAVAQAPTVAGLLEATKELT